MSEMEAVDHITSADGWDDSGLSRAEKRARLYQLQDGKCAICGEHAELLLVDHDHATGLIRGLLCWPCNNREGRLSGNYLDIEAYRANPPAAGLAWMWDWPDPTKMINGDLEQQAIVFMRQRVWDPEGTPASDAHSLLNVLSGRWLTEKRNRALIVALWRGGLRCGEALSLYPNDIDEQAGTINIRGEGKNGGTPRLVGIDPASSVSGWRPVPQKGSGEQRTCSARGKEGGYLTGMSANCFRVWVPGWYPGEDARVRAAECAYQGPYGRGHAGRYHEISPRPGFGCWPASRYKRWI
jgi:hypothetical protein